MPSRTLGHLFLLRELVRRDFQGRYAGSVLGLFWSFLHPLYQLLLYTFVFSVVLKISPLGERTDNFAIFLFAGLLPWMAMQEGIMRGTTAVTDNAALVKKLPFPSEILVLTVVLAALLHEAIAALLFVAVLALRGELAWAHLPWLLLALALQLALTTGLGLGLAALHVFFRDTAQILGMLMGGWFYFTPIVYPLAYVPEKLRPVIEANPLTALVGIYRVAFLGGRLDEVAGLAGLVVWCLVLLAGGLWVFRRARPAMVDEV